MPHLKNFLSSADEQEIIAAIIQAEKDTSGEIRVHLENHTEQTPLQRAEEVFYALQMEQTLHRNAVLFYVGVQDQSFVILGDKGIHDKVESDFWDKTKELVIAHFKQQQYKEGLVKGIIKAGNKLKVLFPSTNSNNDELSNEISRT